MNEYLLWLSKETKSIWWNDSAINSDLESALAHGAQGVTTNPVLIAEAICKDPGYWQPYLKDIPADIKKADKAEAIIKAITCRIAEMFLPVYEKTNDPIMRSFLSMMLGICMGGADEMMFNLGFLMRFHSFIKEFGQVVDKFEMDRIFENITTKQ